jgi:pimeloyl-ACP methyl ester carboxylesterase
VTAAFTELHHGGSGPPLVLIHGFTDTWRTWELVLPALERRHEVLAVTLAGHAGGPALQGGAAAESVLDGLERALDRAGWATADVAGNSLGGYCALRLAERGRARSVVALAPAGGWADGDEYFRETLAYFTWLYEQVQQAAPYADQLVATAAGRRGMTQYTTVNFEHIPAELLAHQIRGAAACTGAPALIESALASGWPLNTSRVGCPVRIVWGTRDRVLPWPSAAERYRRELPQADWVELEEVGHCPQLDVPVETAQLILGWARG